MTTRGKVGLGQYLDSTVDEARHTFQNHPRIIRILDTLISAGLGYLRLGQEMASLSGGEAQRIKLSRELAKRSSGKTLYLLDEPTTGLHNDDINKLLEVLHKLVDKGNTMVIIEHHLDVIKNADYIIDLGPDTGENGGELVCCGTPKEAAKHPKSWTEHYLKPILEKGALLYNSTTEPQMHREKGDYIFNRRIPSLSKGTLKLISSPLPPPLNFR